MARIFPHFLQGYMLYTQESEAPEVFNFWTGVSMIAGAVRRHVWIDEGVMEWTPNFYIIFVAPAGIATKSTSMGSGMRILERVKGVRFGPDSLTWQALGVALQKSTEILKLGPDEDSPKLITSPLTIAASELGTLLKLEDDGLVSMFIAMWDGQKALRPFVHATRTAEPIEIVNPLLNIIGCTTPAWLQQHFPEHLIGGGLTSRIIFIYAERKRHLVPYPGEAWKGKTVDVGGRRFSFRDLEQALVLDLQHISSLQGEMDLSVEAKEWGSRWYVQHQTNPPVHLRGERYGGYRARKQTHLHKLAMILSLSQRDSLLVTLEDMQTAEVILNSVEPHMIKVFNSIGKVQEARHVDTLVATLTNYEAPLTLDELFLLVSNQMSQQDFQEAVHAGQSSGLIVGQVLRDAETGEKIRKVRIVPLAMEEEPGEAGPNEPGESPEASRRAV